MVIIRWHTVWLLAAGMSSFSAASSPPNILLIMADDLGFSDVGCYGGEIETPNLDMLAQRGVRFTQFYNTARCWPTRGALLTGFYAQQIRRDTLPGLVRGSRPDWAPLLPKRLPARYRSYHSGKWHLDGKPVAEGFDRSYWLKDQGRFFYPKVHYQDDRRLDPVTPDMEFYGTTAIADHAIQCLKEHQSRHSDRPFFQYLAFTAPHFPLQAHQADIARYVARYRAGWEEIRSMRWKRLQQLGIVAGSLSPIEHDLGPPYEFPEALETLGPGEVNRPLPWEQLTQTQQDFQAMKMAIHAAMIHCMDREIGRVVRQLRDMNAFDNTVILFLSDNGASAEIMVRADGHDPDALPGSGRSYLCLGPGWSSVANTPFRRHKTWVHQGGIATPLIVHWPAGGLATGRLIRLPGHVVDIVPTLLDMARVDSEAEQPAIRPLAPGCSLLPQLLGKANPPHPPDHRPLWWAHEGNRAIRRGAWKLVAAKGDPWELFHIQRDPTETQNLAPDYPEQVADLAALWESMAARFRRDLEPSL